MTIPIRKNTATFNLSIVDDNIFEGTETFTLTIDSFSLPNKVSFHTGCMFIVTIVDDDGELLMLSRILYIISHLFRAVGSKIEVVWPQK